MSARKPSKKYQASHMRTRKVRGKASNYQCDECGQQAAQWAYDGLDPNAVCELSQRGRGLVTYSTDPAHYRALCRSCHGVIDQAELRLCALARKAGEVAA